MVKWDIPNGGLGYEETGGPGNGTRVQRWSFRGSRAEKWGGCGLVKRPKLGETGEKSNPFCNFPGMENGIIIR